MSKESQRVQKARRKTAAFVRSLKDNVPCADCKVSYPYYMMEFDHVKGEKLFNLSRVTRTNIGMQRILDEIEKCEVVCANCHARRTYFRFAGRLTEG